jgi:glycine cleavage system H protein
MRHLNRRTEDWLKVGGAVALAAVALPVVAVAAFVGRGLLLAAALGGLAAGLVAFALSPGFRSWLAAWTEPEISHTGLRLATAAAYHPFHSWARIEGREATLGADDLVESALGPIDEVDLPRVGDYVRQGEPFARLRRGARAVALAAPVSGTVVAINGNLETVPGLVNRSPFTDGWLARVRSNSLPAERGILFRGEAARAWFRREVDRLVARLAPAEPSPVMADGGALVGDLYRQIDDPRWQGLAEEFFGAARA